MGKQNLSKVHEPSVETIHIPLRPQRFSEVLGEAFELGGLVEFLRVSLRLQSTPAGA